MMRTLFHLTVSAFGLAICASLTCRALAQDFDYEIKDNTSVTILRYKGHSVDVVIPTTLNGLPVTSIGPNAFAELQNLASVTIPNGVLTIRESAFFGCASLTRITIPSSVTRIEWFVFTLCAELTAIEVDAKNPAYISPDGVLFSRSPKVLLQYPPGKAGGYDIPDDVASVSLWAFGNCYRLTSISIPQSLATLNEWMFSECGGLTHITIPNSVTNIGSGAFYACTNLTELDFWGDAPRIWQGAFTDSPKATLFYLPGTKGWGTTMGERPTALWTRPYPVILTTASSFGIGSNGFGFVVSWATNGAVVVETSTSVLNPIWSPLSTNALLDGWCDFRDGSSTSDRGLYYRVRSR